MGQDCLDRRTLSALAAGRCPRKELSAVQRHLPTCARCRAAVVASAAGVRGPGDTVLLTRPGQRRGGPARTALKLASVAASVLVVGAAWFYGSALSEAPPPARTSSTPAPATIEPPARPEPATHVDPAAAGPAPSTRAVAAALQPADVPEVQARLLLDPPARPTPGDPSMNGSVEPTPSEAAPGAQPLAGAQPAGTAQGATSEPEAAPGKPPEPADATRGPARP